MYEIQHYLLPDGQDTFISWLGKLKDTTAKIAIVRRVNRIELGNFGDHRFCRDGVSELRIDIGAGYRVYYTISGKQVVLLLCGGDRRTQSDGRKSLISTSHLNIGTIGRKRIHHEK